MSDTIKINVIAGEGNTRNLRVVATTANRQEVPATAVSDAEFSIPASAESVQILDADNGDLVAQVAVGDSAAERIDVHINGTAKPHDVMSRIDETAKNLNRHLKAQVAAKAIVAPEVERQQKEEIAIARDVRRVLAKLKSTAPDVLQVGDSVRDAVNGAVDQWAGKSDKTHPVQKIRPPATAVDDDGKLKDDQQPTEGTSLSNWILGRAINGDGVLRRPPLRDIDDARIRSELGLTNQPEQPHNLVGGADSDTGGGGSAALLAGSPDGSLDDLVKSKTAELIEAIGLPPDAALIVDPEETGVTGASVREWSGGLADVTAYHDFHELVLALPNVWQQIFHHRLIEIIYEGVEGLRKTLGDGAINDDTDLSGIVRDVRSVKKAIEGTPLEELDNIQYFGLLGSFKDFVRDGADYLEDWITGGGSTGGIGRGKTPQPSGPQAGNNAPTTGKTDDEPETTPVRDRIVGELEKELLRDHSYTVFAADGDERAINFGALITWRQKWDPLTYQTGRIVSTMTLAPGESRKIVTTTKRVSKRHTEEARKGSTSDSNDSTDTSRAESEILRGAEAATNFNLTADGSTNLLVADGKFSTKVGGNNKETGSTARKRFREAVIKSASEYKSEVSTKVSSDTEDFYEQVQTSSIENKNDSIALNAVFYELQRRYRISEELYRMRPVIFVAMPVPDPSEITAGWLIRYDWIIRRSILDKSFLTTLLYLSASYAGDCDILSNLANAVKTHRKAVNDAKIAVASSRALTDQRAKSLSALRKDLVICHL